MKRYEADWDHVGVSFRQVEGGEWVKAEDVDDLLTTITLVADALDSLGDHERLVALLRAAIAKATGGNQ